MKKPWIVNVPEGVKHSCTNLCYGQIIDSLACPKTFRRIHVIALAK